MTRINTDEALRREGDSSETDYVLNDDYSSCWVTVNNISVYIQKTDEGVAVDMWPKGLESADLSHVGTWMTFAEAQEDINEDTVKGVGA